MEIRKHLIIAAIITGLLLPFFASEFFASERAEGFDAKTREKMEKSLDKAMEESRSPGAVAAVWAPGKGTWVAMRGKADLETG